MQRLIYIGIALLGLTFTGQAQSSAWYRTQLLQRLGEANRLTLTAPAGDGSVVVGSCKGYPVVAEWSSGIVSHLGIKLFDPELKKMAGKPLCDFAERYLLELFSCESQEEMERKLLDDGVSQSGYSGSIIGQKELLFSVNSPQTGRYELCWDSPQGGRLYTLTLPANWELISGEHKIELENGLKQQILRHPIQSEEPRTPKSSRMEKTTTQGVWIYKRGHYMIPQMASSLYYREQKGEDGQSHFTLLSEPEHAIETLINILSLPTMAQGYSIEITQQKYGFKSESYSANLGRLISFCLDNGCHPYIGIEESNQEKIVATLLMVNMEWGYNHIIQITTEKSVPGKGSGRMKATLNAYTPTHNLETLYYDDHIKERSVAPKFTIK